jgi:membrane protein DedA with SNARE-associated domain
MQAFITEIMEQYGYIGVFLLMALENIFPPIPSEIILPFSGFMTTHSNLTWTGVLIASTVGSVFGAILLYCIGRLVTIQRLETIIDKWGHVLRLSRADLYKADRAFTKYSYWTVLFCRMIPLIRSLISIPAGMTKMKIGIFLFFTTIGTIIWNALLITIGSSLGENWSSILGWMDTYSTITYSVLMIGFLFLVFRLIKSKK